MPMQFNDALDDPLLFERDEGFRGGVDTFARASLLAQGQYAKAINAVIMDNYDLGTRPGWKKQGDTGETDAFQGAGWFDAIIGGNPVQQVLAIINSAAQSWDGSTWTARAGYTPAGNVTMAQGFDKLLITDGSANMRTYDGTTFVDCGATTGASGDPPKGATILCWHTFRMFAAGKATAPDTLWASDILGFGAGQWDHTNDSIRIGVGDGQPIRALASLQGFTLAVLKSDSVYLVDADPTKTAVQWTVEQLSGGAGCVGSKAWCYAGNDVLFMSGEGVRSLRRMASAAGQYEASEPISQPVQTYIDRINWERASQIVAVNYRSRALFWVPLDNDQTNSTCLVFNIRLGVWEGVWTGPDPTCAVLTRFTDTQRLCIGTTAGTLDEWQDYADQLLETTVQDEGEPYATRIRIRSTQHGEPINSKDGYYFEARLRDVIGDVFVDYVVDELTTRTYTLSPPQGAVMGEVALPFDLAPDSLIVARKSLDGAPEHNESYLEFYNERGRFTLKNVTRAAFLNTLQNED